MNLNRRQFLYLTGAAAAATTLSACGSSGGTSAAGGDKGSINFWYSGYDLTDQTDKTKKPAAFWLYQAAGRYTQKSGVKVKITALPGDATMYTKIRAASIGGNGPDVASVWSGSYMLSIKDYLEPMRPYWTDAERATLSGWPAVTDGFDPDHGGKILGVPNGTDGAITLLYNKEVVTKAGVDWSTDPVDFDTWIGQLDKIKSSGVTPLALGNNSLVLFLLDTWLAQAVGGSTGIGALNTGSRQFSDPVILDVVNKWLSVRPYVVKGTTSTEDDQAMQQVFAGKAAAFVSGAGRVPAMRQQLKDKSAVAKLPNISAAGIQGGTIGGTGVAFIVTKSSKRKQQAVDFIKHMLSADEQKIFAASHEAGPLLGRTDIKQVYDDALLNTLQGWSVQDSNTFWPDNTFSVELVNELMAQAGVAWNGKISATSFLSRLDKKRDSLLKS